MAFVLTWLIGLIALILVAGLVTFILEFCSQLMTIFSIGMFLISLTFGVYKVGQWLTAIIS